MSLSFRAKPSVSGRVRLHPPNDFLRRSCCSAKQQVHGLPSLLSSSTSSTGCKLLFYLFLAKEKKRTERKPPERLRAPWTVPRTGRRGFRARKSQNVTVRASRHQKVSWVHIAPFYSQFVAIISFLGEAAIFPCPTCVRGSFKRPRSFQTHHTASVDRAEPVNSPISRRRTHTGRITCPVAFPCSPSSLRVSLATSRQCGSLSVCEPTPQCTTF